MKKPFQESVVGKILIGIGKSLLTSFLKRQKFVKTDQDKKNIDDVMDKIQFGTLIDLHKYNLKTIHYENFIQLDLLEALRR